MAKFIIVLFLFIPNFSFAFPILFPVNQAVEDTSVVEQKKLPLLKETSILPVPVFYRTPETGFAGGILLGSTFRFAKDNAASKISQLSLGAAYTQKKQLNVYMPFSIFLDNNKYYFNGEVDWFRYNFKYFGIGENTVPAESYDVDFPRIKLLAAKLITKDIYVGVRYLFENYKITETKIGGELASGRIEGSDYSRTSSIGVAFVKDSRDIVFYPHKGIFAEFHMMPTLKVFGADRNFNKIYLDIAHYQSIMPKFIFASHFVGSFMQGASVPFSQLSLLGGGKRMRGIFEGKYRDKNYVLTEAEARFEATNRIGFTSFASLGFLGNETDFIRFHKPKFTFGGGIRFTVIKKDHINLRLDYALEPNQKGNFYVTVGEAF